MKTKRFFVVILAGLAAIFPCAAPDTVQAQTASSSALAGRVSSQEEGPMEGVLVSAKRTGSTGTITVVSDAQGQYSFPRNKLEPGQYSLRIRAVGYELDGPKTADVSVQKTVTVDIKLRKTQDLASQLTNAEWLISMPGSDQDKSVLLGCSSCHSFQRIVKSDHDADEFAQVMARMAGYAPGSSPLRPQRRVAIPGGNPDPERFRKQAEFLAKINLHSVSQWEYPLQTLPRPKGRATHVVITEYDLPRRVAMPHDVILDSDGTAWYSDFGSQYIGKVDPKTGQVTEYAVPELKPGFPGGGLDLELDKGGNLWLGMMLQGGIAKFDRKTEKMQVYPLAKEINNNVAQQAMVMPANLHVDGKVWMNNVGIRGVHRMDLSSGRFETFEPYKNMGEEGGAHSVYGISADSQNNLFFMDFSNENIGRVDAKTGDIKLFPTPTHNSRPRRGHMDSQDRLWFAEYGANRIAMFDTRKGQFQEWLVPTPWTAPYDVVVDKNGEAWTGGMTTDRIVRVDVKSGQATEYLLPRETNVRRVFVDNSTSPVTFWVGNNHGASVVKLEPLD